MRKNEIVNKVNEFVTELGLNFEILGLKTTDDKILYYHNFIDSRTNKFCGIVDFPSVYWIKLANFLCDSEEKFEDYLSNFHDCDNVQIGVSRFKKHLMKSRSLTISGETLQEQINNNKWEKFWEDLQQLFLDPTDDCYLSSFKERIAEGLTGEDIFNWYKKKGGRLLTITTFPLNYVKETISK